MSRNPLPDLLLPHAERRRAVFISYPHQDESHARKLIAGLEAAGHACWIDTSDIKGGDDWAKMIAEGINNSYALVPIITENARRSEWMRKEILWAQKKKLGIIPWALEDLMSADEFILLVNCQWVTFFDGDYDAALEKLLAALEKILPRDHSAPSLPADPAPLPRAAGSPFVVGRPLRANEPIFGREEAFRFIAGELARFSSVNIIGERRMGKTSLLNHLLAHQGKYIIPQPDHPPLVLARVDLQGGVSNASRFYGAALRELLTHPALSQSGKASDLGALRARLSREPVATYDEFEFALRQLRDPDGLAVCPLIVVDEFERLLEDSTKEGFSYPDFFNGIRALMTKELLAMVVASRRLLAEYFSDPARPNGLTSTFPNYFQPFT